MEHATATELIARDCFDLTHTVHIYTHARNEAARIAVTPICHIDSSNAGIYICDPGLILNIILIFVHTVCMIASQPMPNEV